MGIVCRCNIFFAHRRCFPSLPAILILGIAIDSIRGTVEVGRYWAWVELFV